MDTSEFLAGAPHWWWSDSIEGKDYFEEIVRRVMKDENERISLVWEVGKIKKSLRSIADYARGGYFKETDEMGALYNIREMALGALGVEK
jgi:hypothetical protein